VTDRDPIDVDILGSSLRPGERATRAASFGSVASLYERYRPGPPLQAVEWLLPARVARVVDLGAGTGAMTRLLLDHADDVVAVEPDDRMRSVLMERVPDARAVNGRGESMPIPDSCADAVLASSSWHWMDPIPTLNEVGRVLVSGGTLGAVWSGPDGQGPFMLQVQALLAELSHRGLRADGADDGGDGRGGLTGLIVGDGVRPAFALEIPDGLAFDQPEHMVFRWDVALNADELIGLLGTLSSIITMPVDQRDRIIGQARRRLRELLGIDGEVTVDVTFRADAWRSRWNG
jgi:SAM-dependent methyltransferase